MKGGGGELRQEGGVVKTGGRKGVGLRRGRGVMTGGKGD